MVYKLSLENMYECQNIRMKLACSLAERCHATRKKRRKKKKGKHITRVHGNRASGSIEQHLSWGAIKKLKFLTGTKNRFHISKKDLFGKE